MRYRESDVVLNHVLRSTSVVPSVLHLGVADGQLDHGGVGRRHPQRVRVPVRDGSGDGDAGLVVDHRVVVIPEHVLGGLKGLGYTTVSVSASKPKFEK